MIFIVGVKVPDNLLIVYGICRIFGIGFSNSEKICRYFGFLKKTWVKNLSQKDWSNILQYIQINGLKIEKELKKDLKFNIWKLLDIRNYRGLRHSLGLPVRGQRSHSNSQTQRKLYSSWIGRRTFSTAFLISQLLQSKTLAENNKFELLDYKFKSLKFIKEAKIYYDDNLFNSISNTYKFNNLKLKTNKEILNNLIFLSNFQSKLKFFSLWDFVFNLFLYNFTQRKKKKIPVVNFSKHSIQFIKYRVSRRHAWIYFESINYFNKHFGKSIKPSKKPLDNLFNITCYKNIKLKSTLTIYSKYSNIFIYFTDRWGNLLKYISGGSLGLSGKQKGTPYAGRTAMDNMAKFLKEKKIKTFRIFRKGVGPSKKAALKRFFKYKKYFKFIYIKDITPIPHNGCRSRKVKR